MALAILLPILLQDLIIGTFNVLKPAYVESDVHGVQSEEDTYKKLTAILSSELNVFCMAI